MHSKTNRNQGFSMSEVLITLGLMGILAVTMVGLNGVHNNDEKTNSVKFAQAEAAIKTWGKAITNDSETGIGTAQIVESQATLENSLSNTLNLNDTDNNQNVTLLGEDLGEGNSFLLDNGVTMTAKHLTSSCDNASEEGQACAVVTLSLDGTSAEYGVFADRVEDADTIFNGYTSYPFIKYDDAINDEGDKCPYSSGCYCDVTPCNLENVKQAPENQSGGTISNVYVGETQTFACAIGQNGSITKTKVATLQGGSKILETNTCCNNNLRWGSYLDEDNEQTVGCTCIPGQSTTDAGFAFVDTTKENDTCQEICPAGKYQTTKTTKYADKDVIVNTCVLCDAGKYCDKEGMTASLPCPVGYYCPNTPPEGKKDAYHADKFDANGNVIAQGGLKTKIACPVGYYCPTENMQAPLPCPVGHYCPSEGMTEPIACPAGTFNNTQYGKTKDACEPCAAGRYQDAIGQATCKVCACGTYTSQTGSTSCVGVQAGSYPTDGNGNYKNEEATATELCPLDYACVGGCANKLACKKGFYTPEVGATVCIPDPRVNCVNYGKKGVIYIRTQEELAKIGNDKAYPASGLYCQIANINISGSFSTLKAFSGDYDGNNFNINGLGTTLFTSVSGTVHRLGVKGHISGAANVGAIAGTLTGTIKNSFFEGTVKGTGANIGGLVGYSNNGTIKSCYVSGSANTTSTSTSAYVGGLVGQQNKGTIVDAYTASYVTTGAKTKTNTGGFVGRTTNGTITNCYSIGTSVGGGNFVGYSNSTITNSYALQQKTNNNTCAQGVCTVKTLTEKQMKVSKGRHNIYKDWSSDAWCFNCEEFPVLKDMPTTAPDWLSCNNRCSCPTEATGNYDDCQCPPEAPTYDVLNNECTVCPDHGTLYIFRRGTSAAVRSLKNLIYLSGNTELLNQVEQDRSYLTSLSSCYCPGGEYKSCTKAEIDAMLKPSTQMEIYLVSRDGDVVAEVPANSGWSSKTCITTAQGEVCGLNQINTGSGNNKISAGGKVSLQVQGAMCEYSTSGGYYRRVSPLVLDLEDDGFSFTSVENGIMFDLNADGEKEQIGWTRQQDIFDNAFLCVDKNGNGNIDNGKELFGDQSGEATGFEELAKYDSNADGKVTAADEAYSKLMLWVDYNQNGEVDYYREYTQLIISENSRGQGPHGNNGNGPDENNGNGPHDNNGNAQGGGHPENMDNQEAPNMTAGFIEITKQEKCNFGDPDAEDTPNKTYISQCHTDELRTLEEMKITELSTEYVTEYDENGNVKKDMHGNTVGFVGQFKQLVEEVIDGIVQLVEKVKTMIDVFFVSIFE